MNTAMNTIIQAQIDANRRGLEWANQYLRGSNLDTTRDRLINNIIKLRRVKYANSLNPAVAVFGESQVGKSYMVDCLLTSQSSVLNIYDGHGTPTGFIEYINPLGGGKEATSLISRFTTKQVWINEDYPIRVAMLRPIDVVMVLLDSFYNDVCEHNLPKGDAIDAEIEHLKQQYGGLPTANDILTEEDVFELREYFTLGLMERGEAFRELLLDKRYFEELALLIPKIPVNQWANVFSFLWNRDNVLTDAFQKLIVTLQKLNFNRTVYIKMDAVLRSPGTILHVDRICEFFGISELVDDKGERRFIEVAEVPNMDVLVDSVKEVSGISKSHFCALAMELAFTISNPLEEVNSLELEKPFLKDFDILDFPGARSRKRIPADAISTMAACDMLLRGKVAYLFNKYSQQYLISNLLFCHHELKSEVTTLSPLLQGWVENTVGKTPEARADFLRISEISPLFIVGTKFNIDLEQTPDDSKGDEQSKLKAKEYRWIKRFDSLNNLIAPSDKNRWFNQWTPTGVFKNIYLLRSFEYSCQRGLYVGYQEEKDGEWRLVYDADGRLSGERDYSAKYKGFITGGLKPTFMTNEFVQKHFDNPEMSWNEAVEPGNDGSKWIIKNLTKSGANMAKSREEQFGRIQNEAFNELALVLSSFYHDDNIDKELRDQISAAGTINLETDVLFGKDKYFFSDFISAMLVKEEKLHDVVLTTINDTKTIDETDMSALFAIRERAKVDPELPFEENRKRIRDAYECATDEELEKKLSTFNLTIEDIINPPKIKNFAQIIVEAIEQYWVNNYLVVENYEEFIERGMSEASLQSLLNNLLALYREKLKVTSLMAKRIHPYVVAPGKLDDMADMLADICAEMINEFVNTVGSAYYNEELWNDIQNTVEHNCFDVEVNRNDCRQVDFNEETARIGLGNVFEVFDNVDTILNEVPVDEAKLSYFSNFHAYRLWTNLMKISFLATTGIPKYDVNTNNALRSVLKELKDSPALSAYTSANAYLCSLTTI